MLRGRCGGVVVAKGWFPVDRQQGHQRVSPDCCRNGVYLLKETLRRALSQVRDLGVGGGGKGRSEGRVEVFPPQQEYGQVGPMSRQTGRRIGLLYDRAIRAVVGHGLQPLGQRLKPKIGVEEVAGVTVQDGNSQRHPPFRERFQVSGEALDVWEGQRRTPWTECVNKLRSGTVASARCIAFSRVLIGANPSATGDLPYLL